MSNIHNKNEKKNPRLISLTNNLICSTTTHFFRFFTFSVTTHCNHNLSLSLCLEYFYLLFGLRLLCAACVCLRRVLIPNMLISNHKLKAVRLQFRIWPVPSTSLDRKEHLSCNARSASSTQKLIFFFTVSVSVSVAHYFKLRILKSIVNSEQNAWNMYSTLFSIFN